MSDYRTRSTDEMIAAIDGWTDKDEASNHAKWLAHEVRKLRVLAQKALGPDWGERKASLL